MLDTAGGGGVPGQPDRRPGPAGGAASWPAELGGLPLALEQAAAYIEATGTSPGRVPGAVPGPRGRSCWPAARPPGTRRTWPPPWGWRCPGWQTRPRPRRGCCGCWRAWRPSRCRCACCSPMRRPPASLPRRWRPRSGRCWVIRWRPGMRSPRCAATRWSPRPGTGLVLVHRLVQAVTLDRMPRGRGRPVEAGAPRPWSSRDPRRHSPARGMAGVRLLPHAQAALPDQRRHGARSPNTGQRQLPGGRQRSVPQGV